MDIAIPLVSLSVYGKSNAYYIVTTISQSPGSMMKEPEARATYAELLVCLPVYPSNIMSDSSFIIRNIISCLRTGLGRLTWSVG